MRMTNKIMQNNSLYNINNNKVLQDKLSTMMATQKKITRPSDDPVIAIRALRLRTSVSELTQYYEKNAPDAESWLDVTTKALENTVAEVLTNMSKIANKANNKEYGSEDLQVFVEQLKSLRDEFYSTGNLDYAGRYVFTGYRTDTPLTFMQDVEENMPSYQITEQLTRDDFDSINYTYNAGLDGLNKNNYTDAKYDGIEEKNVQNGDIHRIRLSYDRLTDGIPELRYVDPDMPVGKEVQIGGTAGAGVTAAPTGAVVKLAEDTKVKLTAAESPTGKEVDVVIPAGTEVKVQTGGGITIPVGAKVKLPDGSKKTLEAAINKGAADLPAAGVKATLAYGETKPLLGTAITKAELTDNPDPYEKMRQANEKGDALALFIPETGEILISDKAYDAMPKLTEKDEIRVTYGKDKWENGDLRPEHYFACTKIDKTSDLPTDAGGNPIPIKDKYGEDRKGISYNPEYLGGVGNRQAIEYDLGYNQKIQVNTTADKVFVHDLDRDIDDLERVLNNLVEIDATKTDLELQLKSMDKEADPNAYARVKNQYDAAVKTYDYIREDIHKMFGSTITKTQGYLDKTNLAVTDNGTRSQRLALIGNRLMDQRTNFKTLQSENEDIDIAEVVIQLTSTELTYNSALMATGKIMQTSLMNYI